MKYALPAAIALSLAALAGCERQHTSSTTVVKEPTTTAAGPDVVKEKETIVQAPAQPSTSSTTIVNPPAPSPSTSVTIDASKPETTTERERVTASKRVETPLGTIEKSTTESSKTTRQ